MILLAALLTSATSPAKPMPSIARFVGEWRLDRAASRFRGEVTMIEHTPAGYLFDFGAVSFTLPDDGRFHPTIGGRETMLAAMGAMRWRRAHRIHGHVVDQSTLTVSPDGRTMTIATDGASGPPETLLRTGPGTGLAGRWRSTRLGINAANTLSLGDAGGGRLRWGSPADGNFYVVGVDGPPAVDQGVTATSSATLQVGQAADGSLHWTERLNGRPYLIGEDRLSDDGSTLTETVSPARFADERQTLVYRRPPADR